MQAPPAASTTSSKSQYELSTLTTWLLKVSVEEAVESQGAGETRPP